MANAKPISSPMVSSPMLTSLVGVSLENGTQYRQVVGGLQYLCLIRPDILFAVNKVSQYMHQPHDVHWIVVNCILRYIHGIINHGIVFLPSKVILIRFSNVDWASSLKVHKSTSRFYVYLSNNLVGWSSKKQSVVSRSTPKVEY